jgi:hypothetical protein
LFWGVQKIQNMRSPTKSGVPKAGESMYRQSTRPTARIVDIDGLNVDGDGPSQTGLVYAVTRHYRVLFIASVTPPSFSLHQIGSDRPQSVCRRIPF